MVARRYWPFVDDNTLRLMHWIEGLRSVKIHSTVLTARHQASWPERFQFRNSMVHRVLPAPNNAWNDSHFCRNVAQWILKHIQEFDVIYCDRVDSLLSLLATKGAKWPVPIIARFSPFESVNGTYEPESMQPKFPMEPTRRCDALVTPTASGHRFLISQGVMESKIHRLVDPYWTRIDRSETQRIASLRALGNLNGDFILPKGTKLIVHLGMSKWSQLKQTLQNVCDLLDSGASIRLWVMNCGVPYEIAYDYLKDRGWHREVLLFDGFDDLEVLIQCADLVWFSTPEDTIQYSIPAAIAAGVPVMMRDCHELKDYLPKSFPRSTYGSPTDLALNLHRWYVDPSFLHAELFQLRQDLLTMTDPTYSLHRFAAVCHQTMDAKRS